MKQFITLLSALLLVAISEAQTPNMVGYEYWFDQDDAERIYVPISAATTIDIQDQPLNTSDLSLGEHMVHLRLKDQPVMGQARWSTVVSRSLSVTQPSPWEITSIRYWVGNPASDADPIIRYKHFSAPQTVLSYNGLLDLCGYPTGSQTLKLQLKDNHSQWSSVLTRQVTINTAGSIGAPILSASSTSFCPGEVVTFTATPQTGPGVANPTNYAWQVPAGNGWSALPSDSSSVVVTIGNTSGIVQVTGSNVCETGPVGSLPITLPPTPVQPPPIIGPVQACVGSEITYSVPPVQGITYSWQITGGWSVSGGPEASITTIAGLADATISVIAENACGVQAPPRIETITVTYPPDAGSNASFAICSTTAPTNLFPHLGGNPDPGGQWSFNDEPHPGYYVPATDQPGSYTYTVPGAGPCPAATAIVVVAEPQAPDAGTDATLTLCNNAEVQVMTAALGGAPDANGTWSGPSTTNGLFNPASMLAGIYTYLVPGEPPCGYDSATLTITIQQAPNAGTGGPVVLCPASAPVVLFNELGGDPATNGSWTGPQGPTDGTFSPETDLEGSYTYTVPGSGICADNSAVLNVNVMELELATLTGPTMIPAQETLQYTASPLLNDADSILWSLPEGWTWAPEDLDPYDTNAFVTPSAQASTGSVCAQAVGGECNGEPVCVDVDVTVGVSEAPNDGSGVLVYPNPNNGRFTVRSHVTTDQMTFRLLNAIGQEQAEFSTDTGVVSVDMEGLAAGMYTLKWTNRSRSGSRTVILVR